MKESKDTTTDKKVMTSYNDTTIKLQSLKIKGFRSFLEESELSFLDSGLVCVQGKDVRTGGSNGSGKSSLLEAIYWILGLNTLPATELKNYNAASMSGDLVFSIGQDKWEVNRTSTKLSIKVNGEELPGMKTDLQKKIYENVGDAEIFESLSYRRQSDLGKFFYTQDSKLKQFFSKCLPELETLENIASQAQKKATGIELDISNAESVLKSYEEQLLLIERVDETIVQSFKNQIEELNLKISSLKEDSFFSGESKQEIENLNLNIQALERKLSETTDIILSDAEKTQLTVWENEIVELDLELMALRKSEVLSQIDVQISALDNNLRQFRAMELNKNNSEQIIKSNLVKIQSLTSDIIHLSDNKCQTCHRNWDEAEQKKRELEAEKLQLMQSTLSLQKEIDAYPDFELQRQYVQGQIDHLLQQKNEHNAKISNLESKIYQIRKNANSITSSAEMNLNSRTQQIQLEIGQNKQSVRRIMELVKSEFESARNKIVFDKKLAEERLLKLLSDQKTYDAIVQKIDDARNKLKTLESNFELESTISKVVGRKGVLGLYFEDLLCEIESETNQMLSEIPNTSDIAVSISTTSETKSGSTKSEINATITKSGHEISFKSLSGGQRSSLSLCVDLSMMSAIKRRTNIRSGWIALDEAMDGMDVASKEAALNLLRFKSAGSLILLIDHSTEIKELFDSIIEVEYDGKTSRVVV